MILAPALPPWGMGTYKYILHPALTKLVTPTTCLMIVSMIDFMVQVLSLSCGEQLHRCGIIGYNVLSNKTYEQKGANLSGGDQPEPPKENLLQADQRLYG